MKKRSEVNYSENHLFHLCVYDLTRNESFIVQWLKRPAGILEGHGFDSRWRTHKIDFLSNSLGNASSFIIIIVL